MLLTKKVDADGRERHILTETGKKTQSVNLCTPTNVQGDYEAKCYFMLAFWVDEEWFGDYPTFEATRQALWERSYRQLR
jgi:hypothetical protein